MATKRNPIIDWLKIQDAPNAIAPLTAKFVEMMQPGGDQSILQDLMSLGFIQERLIAGMDDVQEVD